MKKKILLSLMAISVLCFSQKANAQGGILPLNGSASGTVTQPTVDIWQLTTNADGEIDLTLTATSIDSVPLYVYLYDNNGTTQLASAVISGKTAKIFADGLAAGTYFVKITPEYPNFPAPYTIANTLIVAPVANDAEPDSSRATAITLARNSTKTGHIHYYYNNHFDALDFYKITTNADGLLQLKLTSNNGQNVSAYLFDNDGVTQLGTVATAGTGYLNADGLAAGTYYVQIKSVFNSGLYTGEFETYTLTDSLFLPAQANDAEPDSSKATAITLALNSTKTGHINYYYNNHHDKLDFYKIITNADGLLQLKLTSNNGQNVDAYLFDNDGVTQLGNVNTAGTSYLNADGLAAGTYYVQINLHFNSHSDYTGEFAPYTLTDSLFTYNANDPEPNGTAATAIDFSVNSNTKGHAGYYYNNQRDTTDWYKLTTTTTGPLYVYLNSSRGSIYSNNFLDMRLTFYSSDGVTSIGSVEVYNNGNPAVDSLFFPTLAAGTYYIKVNNNNNPALFSDYSLSNSVTQGNLPVTFLNFDGKLINNTAQLTWSTATEINNKGFEVQKSSDGQSFAGIGFVAGNNTSSLVNTYNFTDIKVLSGYNYYRLKQVDIDGNLNYSSTIRLDFKNFGWAIFGNPVSSNRWIQLQVAKTSNIVFQIYTIDGKIVKTINKGTVSEGTYSVPLNLANVPAGIYIVKLVSGNQIFSKEIIK